MLGAFKARVAPVNVNYRYVAEELRYLLADSGARAILFHSAFAPTLAEVLPRPPAADGAAPGRRRGGHGLLPGAEWYEDALAAASPRPVGRRLVARRPLHPLHRRHHRPAEGRALAPGRHLPHVDGRPEPGDGPAVGDLDELVAAAAGGGGRPPGRAVHARRRATGSPSWPPWAARRWSSRTTSTGSTRGDICSVVQREKVNFLQLVGDAFGRPIVEEMETGAWTSPRCSSCSSAAPPDRRPEGAVPRRRPLRHGDRRPRLVRGGGQGIQTVAAGTAVSTGTFSPTVGSGAWSAEDLSRVLEPGTDGIGWIAKLGECPSATSATRTRPPGRSR